MSIPTPLPDRIPPSHYVNTPDGVNTWRTLAPYLSFSSSLSHPSLSTPEKADASLIASSLPPLQDWLDYPELDLSTYHFTLPSSRILPYDWKIFMEVFFDNYHIDVIHPSLRDTVDLSTLQWIERPSGLLQIIDPSPHSPFSRTLWLWQGPNLMIEVMGGLMMIASVQSIAPGQCLHTVAFGAQSHLSPLEQQALEQLYWTTQHEDDILAQSLQDGRRAMVLSGQTDHGPLHPHLEQGLIHWFRRFPLWIHPHS